MLSCRKGKGLDTLGCRSLNRLAQARLSAFSLLETSIVLLIMGIMLATVMPLLGTLDDHAKRKETLARQERILKVIGAFARRHRAKKEPEDEKTGVIILPSSHPQEGKGDGLTCVKEEEDGLTVTCSGYIPYLTLQMPESWTYDAWGNPMTYRVTVLKTADTSEAEDLTDDYVEQGTLRPKTAEQMFHERVDRARLPGSVGLNEWQSRLGSRVAAKLKNGHGDASQPKAAAISVISWRTEDSPPRREGEMRAIEAGDIVTWVSRKTFFKLYVEQEESEKVLAPTLNPPQPSPLERTDFSSKKLEPQTTHDLLRRIHRLCENQARILRTPSGQSGKDAYEGDQEFQDRYPPGRSHSSMVRDHTAESAPLTTLAE